MNEEDLSISALVEAGDRDFRTGVLLDLRRALAAVAPGELVGIMGRAPQLRSDLEKFASITGHGLVAETGSTDGGFRFLVRKGPVGGFEEQVERAAHRLWIYTNFDCTLSCAYCCVRSAPGAPARRLDRAMIRQAVQEARPLGFKELYLTGGEPFLRPDLPDILEDTTAVLPVTVLTHGMLLPGPTGHGLERVPKDRVVLQISLDSPDPGRHDRMRGPGTWRRSWAGIEWARSHGYRVRVAATVPDDRERAAMDAFLEGKGFEPRDRLVRPIARRGRAQEGHILSRTDLVPELTLTAKGAYWHPIGADDQDFRICDEILPLQRPVELMRDSVRALHATDERLASVFHCA
jgi:TusA-related sulfurtransferase